MKKVLISIAVSLLLALGAAPVYAADIPPLPHAFYGEVDINDSPAPPGTIVEARGEDVQTGTYNPITTTEIGKYGSADPLGVKLIVQGDISGGTTIYFYVNGEYTGQSYPFDSGETTELPLSVTVEEAPPPPTPLTIVTNIFGIEGSFPISGEGVIQAEIVATSEDENVTITIEAGTTALLGDEPLETLTAAVDPNPPDPPEGAYLMGAYDFGPDGATFDPPITLTWSYDPETVPEGVDLVIAYYDEVNEEWVWVPCEVDTENNIITASIAHFTTFAIIGRVTPPAPAAFTVSSLAVSPAEIAPGEMVNISLLVANTGGMEGSYSVVLNINGIKEAEKSVTIAAGGSDTATFSVTKEEAGNYTVTVDGLSGSFSVVVPPVIAPPEEEEEEVVIPEEEEEEEMVVAPPEEEVPPAKPINWPVLGGIIAGIIILVFVILFIARRRREY